MNKSNKLTVAKASIGIASGELTSEALVGACLERITERDQTIRAWCSIEPELAIASAVSRDNEARRSPLHGIPFGVKDIIETRILKTTYGNRRYNNHVAASDAQIVKDLETLGAVVLGKTVTTEFAYYSPGPTRNPNNPEHTPGGSSSGSAAAVADFQVPFAIGTQTAGSMIRPGSFNGIVALKPSFGMLPCQGVHTLSASLDTLGLFSRSIGDQRLLLTALAPHLRIENSREKPKIAVCKTAWWEEADQEMKSAFTDYTLALKEAGFECVNYDLSSIFHELAEAQLTIMALEASRALSEEYTDHCASLSKHTIDLIEKGLSVSLDREVWARNLTARAHYRLQSVFENFDAILTPSAKGAAPVGIENTGDPVFNRIWTLLGLPCITYPIKKNPRNLPLGVQLVAPFGQDHSLIDMADKINRTVKFGD